MGGNKNKNIPSDKGTKEFNVKENLKKLSLGSGKDYQQTPDVTIKKESNRIVSTSPSENYNIPAITYEKFENINNRMNDGFLSMNKDFTNYKDKIEEKISAKIDSSDFYKWISGIIGAVILIGGIIYTLSYQEIIGDIKEIKKAQPELKNKIDSLSEIFKKSNKKK
jgi:hypothetical protein